MLNVFYCYGSVWIVILLLHFLGWSDLCIPLNNNLLLFFIASIFISLIIGFIFRNQLKYMPMKKNRHSKSTITVLFVIYFIFEILLERNLPIINVILGKSYNAVNYDGINGIHTIVSGLAVVYSFYLAYVYTSFKNKKILYEFFCILMYFILLLQRQNILICLLGFLNILYASNSLNIKKNLKSNVKKTILTSIIIVILLCLLLYGFGVFGNMRYGSNWKWNDSSMITTLGKKNENYPSILPEEYFWSYIYFVSPLVNLNANVELYKYEDNTDIKKFCLEFIPEFIKNKFEGLEKEKIYLPVSSLTASTAYVRVYKYMGFLGIILMFSMQMIISVIILSVTWMKNRDNLVVSSMCVLYFLIFSFFENTFVYSITSLVLLTSLVMSFKYKI